MEIAQTFTTDLVRRAIKSCRNSKAFGPDKLSIFHLKNLGPRAIKYITALFNLSVTTCQIPSIWKSSLIIPIPKPGKDTSLGTSYRPISLLCPAAKVLESLILPTINKYLQPAPDQHGFRPDHSTTSALLQMTTDIAMGFNQRKPPDLTICVAVDLSAAFDTVCHNNLLSKINSSQLPPATARWLSCYLRGRRMKETLFTRHRNTVEPMMLADNRKEILHTIHTDAVNKAVKDQKKNIVLDDLPHPINDSERDLTRKERATLAQLRSGYCKLLGSYTSRIKKDASLDVCADCGKTPHDVKHLFACPAHPTTLIPSDLWSKPVESIREFSYLVEENLD